MSTISTTTPRSGSMFSAIALAIALIALLAFVVAQSAAAPKPVAIPVTGSQNAYVEFLRGEKAIYANPVALNSAVTAYHRGEQAPFALSSALSAYHAGEKSSVALGGDEALTQFLAGKKVLFENPMDLDAAMTAYHIGEK